MKKLKTLPYTLVFFALIFFGGEKDGFSQTADFEIVASNYIHTLLDVQVVYDRAPEWNYANIETMLFHGGRNGYSSGKGNGRYLSNFLDLRPLELMDVQVVYLRQADSEPFVGGAGNGLGFGQDKGNGLYLPKLPGELLDTQVVYMKPLGSSKGNGRMLWKEGHGLVPQDKVGNGLFTESGNLIGNESHGLSKGAEGRYLLRGGSDIGGIAPSYKMSFFGGDAAGI